MSSDNGYILRRNEENKFVLQLYFASNDEYPPIDDPKAMIFDSPEAALRWYENHEISGHWTEYGLTVRTAHVTPNPQPTKEN